MVLTQDQSGTHVSADSGLFSLDMVINRTTGNNLAEWIGDKFPIALDLPFKDLRYEASFENNEVLR